MTTIYLSRLYLNPTNPRARRELANVYELHRTVMRGFPEQLPEGERVLFRLDEDRDGRPTLLVQSQTVPDWSGLPAGYLLAADPFDPIPNLAVKRVALEFAPGQWLRFRLRANPTVKKDRPGQKQGRRVAVVREEAQLAWLGRKAEVGGFCFRPTDVRVTEPGREFGLTKEDSQTGKRHRLELHVVQFDGLLQVTDPVGLAKTLRAGIGPAKGFGCGLLSLAPA
jgi:CRISPR system Cascade subunit CasE